MSENRALIEEYYRHSSHYHVMDDFDIQWHVGNPVCGDDLTVYLRVDGERIVAYSFSGELSMHSQAASSFWGEFFVGAQVDEVLEWTDEVIRSEWFVLSTKRQAAWAIALLAVRNALHTYRDDGVQDVFDDVLT